MLRWTLPLLAVWLLPSWAAAQASLPARFATPVVEGQIEELPPRRDELGTLRVPRLRLDVLGGVAEAVGDTHGAEDALPYSVGGQLAVEVPITGALVVGATAGAQWRRLDADWTSFGGDVSYDGRRGDYNLLRYDAGAFVRVRVAIAGFRLWAGAQGGWSRQRDLDSAHVRNGAYVAPEAGMESCRMVCGGLHIGYAFRRYAPGQGYDPDAYGEFYGGISFSVPLWSPR